MKTVAAGLPNATGYFGFWNSRFISQASGVFSGKMATNTDYGIENSGTPDDTLTYCGANLSLAAGNSIYGKSNTVQPAAITLIPQIKY